MNFSFEIWKALAGVAIFMLGMNFLEDGLRLLTGRKFKLFLRKQTENKLTAIGGGAIVTGFLQSSSVVNLMVLALVGAGTIKMQNALALILGANIGTTLTTWIVATLGFKLNIEMIAFPAVAIAGITRMLFRNQTIIFNWSSFFLGIGFLFVGLDFMKTGMESAIQNIDLSRFHEYPIIIYLLLGILITSLIQSSSATAAITLSALYAGAIDLYMGTAVVLGSEIGTTIKLLLAATGGEPVKKRVALGNFLYNITGTVIIFIFLKPVNLLITEIISIKNPLIALAFFQTFINVVAIVLFYPFLNVFGRFLEKRFVSDVYTTKFISEVPASDTDLAILAFQKEAKHFLRCSIHFAFHAFGMKGANEIRSDLDKDFLTQNIMEQYNFIKQLHGDIYSYYIALQNQTSTPEVARQIDLLISSVRNSMYAAKSIKDALSDIAQLRNSGNETKYQLYKDAQEKANALLKIFAAYLTTEHNPERLEETKRIYNQVQESYTVALGNLYQKEKALQLSDIEISTIINFNREMYTAFKSFVFALKGAFLTPEESEYFKDVPGFIR